ncbi:MAG: hypothetical protein ACJ74C_07445 [Gaiellaceae bacterium]
MRSRLPTLALVAALGCLGYFVVVWLAYFWVAGDTPFVLDGSNAFLTCLSQHDYSACGYTGKLNYWGLMSPVGDWPLLQHVPDVISIKVGANGHPARERILELLNVAAVVGAIALAWVTLSRIGQRAWFWGFLFIVLTSPLIWYTRTTAAEPLAAGLLVCLVAATALRAPGPVIALAAVGACWTKETSYPFVAALGALGLVLAQRRTGKPIRAHLLWGAGGMAVGFTLASLFNEVRFGKVLNPNLFEKQLHTNGTGRQLEYAAGLLVSPSGGMFVFWPTVSVLVLTACLLPLVWRGRGVWGRPALVLAFVIAGLIFGFASWWTPFGWAGYGPRLFLPWGLPLALIVLVAYGEPLGRIARRLLTPLWGLALVFAVGFLFALPHVGHMWRPHATDRFFDQPKPRCDAPWRGGEAKWNACQHEQMWLDRPMPLYALHGLRSPAGIATAFVLAGGLLGCLVLLRRGLAVSDARTESRTSGSGYEARAAERTRTGTSVACVRVGTPSPRSAA